MQAPLYKRDDRSGSSNPDIGAPVTLTSELIEAREAADRRAAGQAMPVQRGARRLARAAAEDETLSLFGGDL